MKTLIALVLLAGMAWAVDQPKPADATKPEIKFTPELQHKLQTVMLQQYQIEFKIKNLDEQYRQFSQQFQQERATAAAQEKKLEQETLEQLLLDPKTHKITLDASGDLKIEDVPATTK